MYIITYPAAQLSDFPWVYQHNILSSICSLWMPSDPSPCAPPSYYNQLDPEKNIWITAGAIKCPLYWVHAAEAPTWVEWLLLFPKQCCYPCHTEALCFRLHQEVGQNTNPWNLAWVWAQWSVIISIKCTHVYTRECVQCLSVHVESVYSVSLYM